MKESFTYAVVRLFGYNEPVLVEDLLNMYPDISRQAVYKKLEGALEEGSVIRFDRGVYYVPEKTEDGNDVSENADGDDAMLLLPEDFPQSVAKRRWLEDYDGNVFGHIAGSSLVYECGLIDERPQVLEITTNKESSRVREVSSFGPWEKILLRHSRFEITSENVRVQRFLELITSIPLDDWDERVLEVVSSMAKGVDREMAYECLESYPGKTAKRFAYCERRRILG